jgi:site-specific recombinase XerD
MEELEDYLESKYQPQTVKAYLYDIGNYTSYVGETAAQNAKYSTILDYIAHLRERPNMKTHTIQRVVSALKKYYDYLIESEQRTSHPCQDFQLRDKSPRSVQIQDLFTPQELQSLLHRTERYALLKRRNTLIMSLLVHQALTATEIVNLHLNDVDLDRATINIRQNTQNEGRILDLKATQISLFYGYINEDRLQLSPLSPLSSLGGNENPCLILSKLENMDKMTFNTEGVQYLVSTFQPFFNRKLTPTTIRQSVIANRLKVGEDLRHVQIFAGHRRISSTERYKVSGLDALKNAIQKHHPLDKPKTIKDYK